MPGLLVGEFVEAVMTVVRGLRAHAAPDLDDVARCLARAAEQFDGIFAGRAADQLVVAADELRVLVGFDVAVEHEDRDLGVDRLLHDAGQAGQFLRRDQQRVDFLADQVLDVGHLLLGLVLTVGDDELDIGMLGGFGDDVLVELGAPRLDRRRLAEADLPFLVLRDRRVSGQKAVLAASAAQRRRAQEFTTFHLRFLRCCETMFLGGRLLRRVLLRRPAGRQAQKAQEVGERCAPARARCR